LRPLTAALRHSLVTSLCRAMLCRKIIWLCGIMYSVTATSDGLSRRRRNPEEFDEREAVG
ncbi:MAG TPA: hypothetical protein VLV54_19345, partial [Thermoanaerobaculia bacterium]|nr:hypothetical protein [Thermoanaerobaculia bacterium]